MKRVFAFGLTTVFLLSGVISCHFQRSYTLEGYVYESFSKTPLPGITIQCANLSAITNKDGFFQINPLAEKKVPILVGKHKNYTDLTDTLLLDQKVSHRDFVLDAKHPLGIDLRNYRDPLSYAFSFQAFNYKKTPTAILSGKMVPIDESLQIIGKQMDQSNKWIPVEAVHIGISFFDKDEFNNWNEPLQPNAQALQFQSDAEDLIKTAYHFYEDPLLSFTEDPGNFTVDRTNCTLFRVSILNDNIKKRQYEIYLVKDGEQKGQAKKIIRTFLGTVESKDRTMISLILSQWNEDYQILPPQITQ
jgi:hypothetical protein